MRLPFTGLSNIQKFFISLALVFAAAIIDLHLFTRKSTQVELYDGLTSSVSNLRVSISKLEYLLDMFVVARRFESSTIDLIKEDVEKLDSEITGVLGDPRFLAVIKGNAQLSDGLNSITDDWHNIKTEVGRLNEAINQDEAMLIHNAVDIHTVLVIEKADRLLGSISESRQAIFDDIRSLEYKSIIGFVLFALFVSFAYYKRVFSPVEKAARTARRVSTGSREARFSEDQRSLLGRLGRELNAMLETLAREMSGLKAANSSLKERLAEEGLRIRAFSSLMSCASNSLSQNDVLNVALNEAASGTGADAGAVFVMEEGQLRLRASYGFGSAAPPRELQQTSAAVLNGMEKSGYGGVFHDIRGYPDSSLGEFLKSRGFESLLCLPISYNRETLGCFLVIFKGGIGDAEAKLPFVEALARGAAVSIGHAGLFQGEYNARRFVERVIHQMPFGVAVFDEKGSCRLLNTALKKMLGAEKADLGGYEIMDDALASQGMLAPVKKAYEGYAAEFTINYNPADIKRFNLSGPQRRFKVKSFPLYGAGGDISNIVVLYEELPGAPGESAGTGDAT